MKQTLTRILTGIKDFFITVWRQKAGKVLLVGAGVLLLAAAGLGIGLYLDGIAAEGSARQLLTQYQQSVNGASPDADQVSADDSQAETDPDPGMLEGYDVVGILTLEKTNQTLPVISETTDKALKVSVCWFQGTLPGNTGNMVITGHDYASGAHFGQLSKLKAGDRVTFADANRTYTFEVYETEVIRPDQPEKLDDYEGDTALTLLTCTNHGNRRLVVRCKPLA